MITKKIKNCRVCNSDNTAEIVNLGKHPLANSLNQRQKQHEKKYELKVLFCKKCKTPQLTLDINPKTLFSKYVWQTSTSELAKKFSEDFYKIIIRFPR